MKHSTGVEIIRQEVKTLPELAGVYRMLDAKGQPLYVGKAANLKKRVAAYTQPEKLPLRLQRMVMATASMEIVVTKSEVEALLLEANLVKELQPRYNILLKDDKSFPYIMIDESHPFPRIGKHRGARKKGVQYFGPYANAGDVNRAMATIQRMFLLRPCSDTVFKNRTRPCMEYQIKRCSGPCVRRIEEAPYAELVREAKAFLSGKNTGLKEKLEREMEEASRTLAYEKAAELRDRLKALSHVQGTQSINTQSITDADIIGLFDQGPVVCVQVLFLRGGQTTGSRAFFPAHTEGFGADEIMEAFLGRFYQLSPPPPLVLLSHVPKDAGIIEAALRLLAGKKVELQVPSRGARVRMVASALASAEAAALRKLQEDSQEKELLEGVARIFNLDGPPQRIEVYDNSHISGKHAVGAMIVAGPGGFSKANYRRFTVDPGSLSGGDDYAMLREVLTRRFARLQREDPDRERQWPDLVLIDGGAGQLTVAEGIFADLGITGVPMVAIAKGPDRNAGTESFHMPGKAPFRLPPGDPVLFYLERLRDEAHRFAIFSHRAKRSRAISQSEIDALQGIGPKRKKALLLHFGSVRAIRHASAEEIAKVPGISLTLASSILQQLR